MPYRSWLLVAALALAVIVVVSGGYYSWRLFSAYQESHASDRQQAIEYDRETAEERPSFCGSVMTEVSILEGIACLGNSMSFESNDQQSRYELKAQQDMAAWALGMLIVTVWLSLITFLGVVFVWKTLVATREIATDTRSIGKKQIRPYVAVNSVHFSHGHDSGEPLKALAVFSNIGVTPAFELRTSMNLALASQPGTRQSELPPADNPEFFGTLGNGVNAKRSHLTTGGFSHNRAYQMVINEGWTIHIYGKIEYSDIFGDNHETNFSWRVDKHAMDVNGGPVPERHGNEAS